MDIYHDLILDHYKYPRNYGELKDADATSRETNAFCGDTIEISLTVGSTQTITTLKWHGAGCAISAAAASLLSEKVKGMSVAQVGKLTESDMLTLLGGHISHARIGCATLPLQALHHAVASLDRAKR